MLTYTQNNSIYHTSFTLKGVWKPSQKNWVRFRQYRNHISPGDNDTTINRVTGALTDTTVGVFLFIWEEGFESSRALWSADRWEACVIVRVHWNHSSVLLAEIRGVVAMVISRSHVSRGRWRSRRSTIHEMIFMQTSGWTWFQLLLGHLKDTGEISMINWSSGIKGFETKDRTNQALSLRQEYWSKYSLI